MTATTATLACIGEPISWPRLERFALEPSDAHVRDHVAACPACRACLDEIERDVVALPPLTAPATPRRRRWWTFALPAGLAVAAAAIALLVLRPRDERVDEAAVARVKGIGRVVLEVVREREGVVRDDVRTFRAGDRFKLLVTCAAETTAWVDAFVLEAGAERPDYPLTPAQLVCGNRIALPGAFSLTGDKPHQVCVRVATGEIAARPVVGDRGVACVTLAPE